MGCDDVAHEAEMTLRIDLERRQIVDTELECCRQAVARHRDDVVSRLLTAGLSAATLRAILPDFGPIIDRHTDASGTGPL